MNKAAIIIVNWNTGDLLSRCLVSIQNLPEIASISRVIVVDNNSHDESVARARQAVSHNNLFHFVELNENAGFAKANNIGFAWVADDNANVFLLNPDTEVKPGAVMSMLEALESGTNIGIVGPKLLNPNGSVQESVRRFPSLLILFWFAFKLNKLLPRAGFWQNYMHVGFDYSRQQTVDQVMGAAFLVRRSVWDEIGGLDEGYWIWFEEVDFCKRALNLGFVTLYTPHASVVHHGGLSFGQLGGLQKYRLFIRSALRYARKHFV